MSTTSPGNSTYTPYHNTTYVSHTPTYIPHTHAVKLNIYHTYIHTLLSSQHICTIHTTYIPNVPYTHTHIGIDTNNTYTIHNINHIPKVMYTYKQTYHIPYTTPKHTLHIDIPKTYITIHIIYTHTIYTIITYTCILPHKPTIHLQYIYDTSILYPSI